MIEPTDELCTRFDSLNAMAAQRGLPESRHAHPSRYGETLRVEKLEAARRGTVRTSAVRATVRLKPAPDKDRYAFVHLAACFQTGRYAIAYYEETGHMVEASTGVVAYHRLYLDRRDVRQALGTGFDLAILGCLVRILRDGGHSGEGEELADMRSVMHGEGPDAFRAECWPKVRALFETAPVLTDPARTLAGLTVGRWVGVAKEGPGLQMEIFRLADGSKTSPEECYFRAEEAAGGFMITAPAGETAPGFPRLDDMPLGTDASTFEPTKVVEVPDALVAEIRGFVPPWFPESFQLDL